MTKKILVFGIFFILLSCFSKDSETGGSQGSDGGAEEGGDDDGSSETRGIYFKLESAWEGENSEKEVEGECEILATETIPATDTCRITVREGKMHFSKFFFTVGTDKGVQNGADDECEQLTFLPYYYRAALTTDTAFFPPWSEDAVDCSETPISEVCFNGVGKEIIPDFPRFSGIYFITTDGNTENTYEGSSPNEVGDRSNRYYSNNIGDPLLALSGANRLDSTSGDFYINGTHQDYQAICYNRWREELFHLTIYLNDEDVAPGETEDVDDGVLNDFGDWTSSSNAIDPQP